MAEKSQNGSKPSRGRKRRSRATEEAADNGGVDISVISKVPKKETHVLVLDGGMGRELDASYPDPDFKHVWSAAHLLNQPESVFKCHQSFINSGAELIITSNYSAVPKYLDKINATDKMYELIEVAGEVAEKAKKQALQSGKEVRVVGSIPPFDFSYLGSAIPEKKKLIPEYVKIVKTLSPYVDIFICETMSSLDEAITALSGIQSAMENGEFGDKRYPIWLSFSLQDNSKMELHSGEKLEFALEEVLDKFPGLLSGLFINCCTPQTVTQSLPTLIKIGRGNGVENFGAYANNFSSLTSEVTPEEIEASFQSDAHVRKLLDIPLDEFVEFAKKWIEMGCNVIGGCCGIGPKYIEKLRQFVDKSCDVQTLPPE